MNLSVENQLSDYELVEFFRSLQDLLALSLDANLSFDFAEFLSRTSRWFRENFESSSRVRVSHPSERQPLSDLDILLHIVSQQRQYCVNLSYFALHEEDEQQSTTRVGVRIVRSGVGRPRLDISEDLLEALLCNSWISLGCHRKISSRL